MNGTMRVSLWGKRSWCVDIEARLDSGAARTSIDRGFADLLGLDLEGSVKVRNANGSQKRDLVWIEVEDETGAIIELEASLADRSDMSYPAILGRDYMGVTE